MPTGNHQTSPGSHRKGGGNEVGWVKLHRKITRSDIWTKPPVYLKLWLLILTEANYATMERKGFTFGRGEMVTTYRDLAEKLAHFENRRTVTPGHEQIRYMLKWLINQGQITVEPVKKETEWAKITTTDTSTDTTTDPKGRTSTETTTYLGIKITVLNYDSYHDSISELKQTPQQTPEAVPQQTTVRELAHNNKKEKKERRKNPSDFLSLCKRFRDQDLLQQVFEAIRSTRKSGRVSENVLAELLQWCDRYPAEQVEAGFRTYLEKDYASEGKDEKYLKGIIRNGQAPKAEQPASTGSDLLDTFYQRQGAQ